MQLTLREEELTKEVETLRKDIQVERVITEINKLFKLDVGERNERKRNG